ncbi:hypothetical protein [Sinorhizobium meliloti]|uniref:Uncharacterized protein n=1 Tax=Sinorhizobium meliloti (strain SM11) TaxID=707241 RepID=F7XBX8_SINMM|nr:hypothetical protein [Sinorhizobium meliloti]AEH82565.1 hypothetical protein SM11_pC1492 [Sinorhizobium meliloti SM11]MBP2470315.1 hypothetical protein [Sinorhizobium meliloti]MCM5694018.1 hypothetical protein [Sinorhizobium meliloti]MDE3762906.1 hypothetical protein [Sinorhizobium meliloti]MDE3776594.1 hypothetical protein [Sinorhizobium meliloti]
MSKGTLQRTEIGSPVSGATMSIAYCALEAYDGRENDEYRFWFGLFLKLAKREHVGWA